MPFLDVESLKGIFEGSVLDTSKKLICNTDDSIFAWQENVLRVQRSNEEMYRSYDLDLPFVADSMVSNGTGDVLAFHSEQEVYVVEIREEIRLRKHLKPEVGLRKVLWHPLATYDLALVMLHKDSSIEIYELDGLAPEPSVFYNRRVRSFGLSDHVPSVCDICFDQTGVMLYLLSSYNFCDVHVIYPFLPSNFTLSKGVSQSLEDTYGEYETLDKYMFHKSLSQFRNLDSISGDEGTNSVVQDSDFLILKHDLLKQIKFYREYQDQVDIDSYTNRLIGGAVPQGPFIVKSFPSHLEEKEALSLSVIPLSSYLGLLCVQFTDGTNLILFPDSDPIMAWSSTRSNIYNTLSVITVFKAPGKAVLLNRSDATIAFIEPTFTSLVQLPWIEPLSECIAQHDFSAIKNTTFETQMTLVSGNFTGAISALEADVLYGQDSIQTVERKPRPTPEVSKPKTVKDVEYIYRPALPTSIAEVETLLKKYKLEATSLVSDVPDSLATAPFKNESNEKQLEVVSRLYKEVMGRVKLGQMIAYRMFREVNEQVAELHRQLRKTNEINIQKSKLETNLISLEARLAEQKTKANMLNERLDKFNSTLSQIEKSSKLRTAGISEAEAAWFKSIKSQVFLFNSHVRAMNDLREQLEFVTTQLKALPNNAGPVTEDQFVRLQRMLLADKKVINACIDEISASIQDLSV